MRIDQLIPAFHRGDAIGDTAFHLRTSLRARGFESHIYCLNHDPELAGEARLFADFPPPAAGDVTILHFALPSPLTDGLLRLPSRKFIIYHNITPPEFFAPYNAEMARLCRIGREELARLAPRIEVGLADSEYNRRELEALGAGTTREFPLHVDFARYEKPASAFVRGLFEDGRTNILFVGRIVPNKRIEDLIKVVFYYKKYISPLVRLVVVGKTSSLPVYYRALVQMADEFYLKPEEITFAGHIPDEEMYALYRASHVFLSLSEHEGFCLPLVESMVFDLPIVAYDSTAVPFTLGGAGVLLRDKRVDRTAELVDLVARDAALREAIIAGQRRRLAAFKAAQEEAFLFREFEPLLRSR
jgi:glycosyltransferase involved in cell wall biosynthesis